MLLAQELFKNSPYWSTGIMKPCKLQNGPSFIVSVHLDVILGMCIVIKQ